MPLYERLSAQDSSFVMFEHRATHMHVAAVAILGVGPLRTEEGGLDAARIARYVESRLSSLPRYRQKLSTTPLQKHPIWIDDDHFDLHYHVRHTALPQPGGDDRLKALCGRILSQPLDRGRPLWELWLVEGLEGDRFAIVSKVHHCMVDGASGVSLLTLLFRDSPDDEIHGTEAWFPRTRPASLRLAAEELWYTALAPASIARDLGRALLHPEAALRWTRARGAAVGEALRAGLRRPPTTALNEPIGPHRRVEWRIFPLDEIKRLRRALGGTVNDVVLTLVTGAVRRFLARRGEKLEGLQYRVVVPVNMRADRSDQGAANRVSAFFLSLPVGEDDPRTRFDLVRQQSLLQKTAKAADGIDFFTQLVDRSGSTLLTRVGVDLAARMQPYNLIVNVPGPQLPLYVLGARLEELHPLPPLFERQGLGIAVLSYDGRVCWGLVADRDVVPDLAALAGDLDDALDELRQAAHSTPPRRAAS